MAEFRRLCPLGQPEVPKYTVYPNNDGMDALVCDSPIEGAFAEALFKSLHIQGLLIEAQYSLGPYRYDFAITLKGCERPAILIECDGRNYHWTQEQRANDHRKNLLAGKHGIALFRFTGSEIYNKPSLCIDAVLIKLECLAGDL